MALEVELDGQGHEQVVESVLPRSAMTDNATSVRGHNPYSKTNNSTIQTNYNLEKLKPQDEDSSFSSHFVIFVCPRIRRSGEMHRRI